MVFCPLHETVPATDPSVTPSPVLAAVFAVCGVSLGQFYIGRPLCGIAWGAGGMLVFFLIAAGLLPFPAAVFFLAACGIDAGSAAQEMRAGAIPYTGPSLFFPVQVMLGISSVMAAGLAAVFGMV